MKLASQRKLMLVLTVAGALVAGCGCGSTPIPFGGNNNFEQLDGGATNDGGATRRRPRLASPAT